ncbi:hypothetical protein HK096_007369 [Nowakowskiella sp. JEL0078]|nr:hypothetical protein HK096_007369 [Nowakowskiella sp. JEL0078]
MSVALISSKGNNSSSLRCFELRFENQSNALFTFESSLLLFVIIVTIIATSFLAFSFYHTYFQNLSLLQLSYTQPSDFNIFDSFFGFIELPIENSFNSETHLYTSASIAPSFEEVFLFAQFIAITSRLNIDFPLMYQDWISPFDWTLPFIIFPFVFNLANGEVTDSSIPDGVVLLDNHMCARTCIYNGYFIAFEKVS